MKNEFKYGDTQYWLQKYILITVLLLNFDLIGLLNLLGLSLLMLAALESTAATTLKAKPKDI